MSDGTGTMSVQLVLCVADSVWRRAAGHFWLGSACPRGTRIAPAHDAAVAAGCALLSSTAVTVISGTTETAAGDGVMAVLLLWPIRQTIGV